MMIIRKANVNDLNDIYQLMDSVDNKWFFKDDREYVYRHFEEEGFILVVDDDEIVAYLMVHYVDYDEDVDLHHVVYMDSVGVLESMRGHSLMKKLILYAEDVLRKNGYKYFMATVHPDNIYSYRVLNCLGYNRVKTVYKYNHLKRYLLLKSED